MKVPCGVWVLWVLWWSCAGGPVWAAEGISNQLMNAPSAAVLPEGTMNISLTYQTVSMLHVADVSTTAAASQGPFQEMQWALLAVVGVGHGLEIGANFPVFWRPGLDPMRAEHLSVGGKWGFYESPVLRFSVGLGGMLPLQRRTFVGDVVAAATIQITPRLSLEMAAAWIGDLQWTPIWSSRYDVGVGFFLVPEKFQVIVEWGHEWWRSDPMPLKGGLGLALLWQPNPLFAVTLGAVLDPLVAQPTLTFSLALALAPNFRP